jgi:hypothetical protein
MMSLFKKMNELVIPPAAKTDPKAAELIRVWAAGGAQHISVNTNAWEDPFAWGICLVDLAKLVADAYHQTKGLDSQQTLARIKQGFDAEWGSPTDEPTGKVLD